MVSKIDSTFVPLKKVLIFDTSVLCVWLKVPGKETCGQEGNHLTFEVVDAKIEDEKKQNLM